MFKLKAQTIIQSATLELTAAQLDDLRTAAPLIKSLVRDIPATNRIDTKALKAADTVLEFLQAVTSTVSQVGIIQPKRTIKRRKKQTVNPTSPPASATTTTSTSTTGKATPVT